MIRILTLCGFLFFLSCSNNDDHPLTPLEQLPEATQNGAQTFGCLVNGEAFIPSKIGRNAPRAFYQFVRGSEGSYTLGISAAKRVGEDLISTTINTVDSDLIQEGSTYPLIERSTGNFFGTYNTYNSGVIYGHTSTTDNPGSVTITKFDPENYIISGTFEFTATDNDGNTHEITEGRFDLNYTN